MKLEILREWLGEFSTEAVVQNATHRSENPVSKAQVDQLRELFPYGFHLYREFEVLLYDYPQEFLKAAPCGFKRLGENIFADKRLVRLVLEPKVRDGHAIEGSDPNP